MKRADFRTIGAAIAAAAVLALGVSACGGGSSSTSGDSSGGTPSGTVNVVGYSVLEDVYTKSLEPGYQATPDGADVDFSNSWGASGDQSRAVEAGQPADIVHFSLAPDMTRLVDDGIVSSDWDQQKYNGIAQDSVVTFLVRQGNPKNITSWDDLLRPDVSVLTPNPFTSGGARWNIMAAYGAQIEQGKTPDEALAYVKSLLENTDVQDKSAGDALTTFLSGKGDVLISYESDAIRAQDAGEDVDYFTPDETIKIETPIAVPEDAQNPDAANSFLDFIWSKEGQTDFAKMGYRPVDPAVAKQFDAEYPPPKDEFTIDDLGGWDKVSTEFFDPDNGSVAEIEKNLGVSTG